MHRDELWQLARDLDIVEAEMRQNEAKVTRIRMRVLRAAGLRNPERLTLAEQQQAVEKALIAPMRRF